MSLLNISRVTLPPGVWTPIMYPVGAYVLTITNRSGQSINLRSDPADEQTQDYLLDGSDQPIGNVSRQWQLPYSGTVLIYAQPSTDVPAVILLRYT